MYTKDNEKQPDKKNIVEFSTVQKNQKSLYQIQIQKIFLNLNNELKKPV